MEVIMEKILAVGVLSAMLVSPAFAVGPFGRFRALRSFYPADTRQFM
jgi:hypothetical protein